MRLACCGAIVILVFSGTAAAQQERLIGALQDWDAGAVVLGPVRQAPLAGMLARDVQARLRSANRADRAAWTTVGDRTAWERLRDERLARLRASLGTFPRPPRDLKTRVIATHAGDGYSVDNLVFESRPGVVVTANLYRPAVTGAALPGIVIVHSHHQPKHTGARQDMAMTWARAGCLVLVPDLPGHGERRQHPFGSDVDSAPHDYHFRYDLGMQLHLVGDSLMGWMAWDLMRGVDLLLAESALDRQRIVLVSEPAGGGDVAAVTAALDSRIAGVVVNNFGGPQPETPYPLAADAEESFDYAGGGSWESTRNLRCSARDGFLPWTIVAASAPRRVVYYHEFYWDRGNDPVWARLQKVYSFYGAGAALEGVAGQGFVVGAPPQNTHWIARSRELLYPTLERWFHIKNPGAEYDRRRPPEELLCLAPAERTPLLPLLSQLGAERAEAARRERAALAPAQHRARLRQQWAGLLGDVAPKADPVVAGLPLEETRFGRISAERIHLVTEPGIVVPLVLLRPPVARAPVVLALAQEGKLALLRQRAETLAALLDSGVAVCVPDLRGCGETSPGTARDRRSSATALSASELMFGQTLLGSRLRDLRSVLCYLRQRPEIDATRLAMWGDCFSAPNPDGTNLAVPYSAEGRPAQAEPLGGLLALLAGLFEDDVQAVYVRGGLSDYQSMLETPFCYVPHDAVVPGILTVGDLADVAAALAPRPLCLHDMVDGHNRPVAPPVLAQRYNRVSAAYRAAGAPAAIQLGSAPASVARWLAERLKS